MIFLCLCCNRDDAEPHSYSAYSADVWAVGVTLYTFLHGSLPFFEDTPTALFASIQENPPAINTALSPTAQDFLRRILAKDTQARVTLAEVRSNDAIDCFRRQTLLTLSHEMQIRESDWMAEARAELQAALEELQNSS